MIGSFIEIKRNSLCKSVTIDCSRSYHHACGKRLKIDERVCKRRTPRSARSDLELE